MNHRPNLISTPLAGRSARLRPWRWLLPLVIVAAVRAVSAQPAAPGDAAVAGGPVLAGPAPTEAPITAAQIDEARAKLADSSLDEAGRDKATAYLDQADRYLTDARAVEKTLQQLRDRVDTAPKTLADARARQSVPDAAPANLDGLDVAALETLVAARQVDQTEARERQKRYQEEAEGVLTGGKGLNAEIAAKAAELTALDSGSAADKDQAADPLGQSRRLSIAAERRLRRVELDLLEARLGSQGPLAELARVQAGLARERLTALDGAVARLTAALAERRKQAASEARKSADELRNEVAGLPAPMRDAAGKAAAFRAKQETLVRQRQQVEAQLNGARARLHRLRSDFDNDQQRVQVVGTSEAIGRMLHRRRDGLPNLYELERSIARQREAISVAADRQVELYEFRRQVADVETLLDRAGLRPLQRARLADEATRLVAARDEALSALEQGYGGYITELSALESVQRELLTLAGHYRDYIDDQLLEIRGPGLWSADTVPQLVHGLAWMVSPVNWAGLASDVLEMVIQRAPAVLALAALVTLLFVKARTARDRLLALSNETRKIRTDRFSLTIEALGWTLVLALPWPLLCVGFGWLLGGLAGVTQFSAAIAHGLVIAGLALAAGKFLRQICRKDGLADRHLRWFGPLYRCLHRELRWAVPLVVSLLFLASAAADPDLPSSEQVLAQVAFVALMAVWILVAWRLVGRGSEVMTALAEENRSPLMRQLHFLWLPALLLLPLALAGMVVAGYQALAFAAQARVEFSFWLLVGLRVLRDLLQRYLSISERRLRFEEAIRRREEMRARRLAADEHPGEEEAQPPIEVAELDFSELGDQAQRLVHVAFLFASLAGLWFIWSELASSLDVFDHTSITLAGAEAIVGGDESAAQSLTLGSLLFFVLVIGVTLLAAKNIPGVLEIALLQRLPLDPGTRYTVVTVTQYLIAGVGLVVALGSLGLQWDKIQWLVAALGVGLGFGLQEIVANFISGIILLFERPIRVGDVVTLDGTTGVVSRIRIRATAITNFDRQELLIPNKAFITGQVVNWTLSDKINRIVITVGVAYGTDVDQAMALLSDAARENAEVLEDPKPLVSFEGFGDDALTLVLRTYLATMDNRLGTITALHRAINTKFAQAGIAIAFPQRDVHLDTDKPLDIRLHRTTVTRP